MDNIVYIPIIRPENIPVVGENVYKGIYASKISRYIVRNYAANHPHIRELCARSMKVDELALMKMLFPDGERLNSYDDEGMTPLMSCIRSWKNRNDCNFEAVKFLVEAEDDVKIMTTDLSP